MLDIIGVLPFTPSYVGILAFRLFMQEHLDKFSTLEPVLTHALLEICGKTDVPYWSVRTLTDMIAHVGGE